MSEIDHSSEVFYCNVTLDFIDKEVYIKYNVIGIILNVFYQDEIGVCIHKCLKRWCTVLARIV